MSVAQSEGRNKMKHCITVNYAQRKLHYQRQKAPRTMASQSGLSRTKPAPLPLYPSRISLGFGPAALWHFLRVETMTTCMGRMRRRMSCDSKLFATRIITAKRKGDPCPPPAAAPAPALDPCAKTDEQFMT